jgi:hypothetical protein
MYQPSPQGQESKKGRVRWQVIYILPLLGGIESLLKTTRGFGYDANRIHLGFFSIIQSGPTLISPNLTCSSSI